MSDLCGLLDRGLPAINQIGKCNCACACATPMLKCVLNPPNGFETELHKQECYDAIEILPYEAWIRLHVFRRMLIRGVLCTCVTVISTVPNPVIMKRGKKTTYLYICLHSNIWELCLMLQRAIKHVYVSTTCTVTDKDYKHVPTNYRTDKL